MPNYIQLTPHISPENSNPTPQQRSIYLYHESRYSTFASDIYSEAWFERTQSFAKTYRRMTAPHLEILTSWEMLLEMELGTFYLANPVPGFALWGVLEAFYRLDRIVCGDAEEDREVREWRTLKPFLYFQEEGVKRRWRREVELLRTDIEVGRLAGECLVNRLYDILCAIENLENAVEEFGRVFEDCLTGLELVDGIITAVRAAMEERCFAIADGLEMPEGWTGGGNR